MYPYLFCLHGFMHLPTIEFPKARNINIPMEKCISNKLFMRKTSDIFVFFLSVRNSLIRLPLSVPRSTIKERPRLAQEQCCLLRAWNSQQNVIKMPQRSVARLRMNHFSQMTDAPPITQNYLTLTRNGP